MPPVDLGRVGEAGAHTAPATRRMWWDLGSSWSTSTRRRRYPVVFCVPLTCDDRARGWTVSGCRRAAGAAWARQEPRCRRRRRCGQGRHAVDAGGAYKVPVPRTATARWRSPTGKTGRKTGIF